ncbi:MAG: hypothetical protein WCZ47_04210 [Bacilli bacterium]|jgi:hypothetical protein|nr:hypothetical protein [Bacilli bacterium]
MSDKININRVENFINSTDILDNSLIGRVISTILENKNNNVIVPAMLNDIPYSIEEKISLNKISENIRVLIIESWAKHYNTINDTVEDIVGTSSPSLIEDIYEFYRHKFIEALSDLGINHTSIKNIQESSNLVFSMINNKVKKIFQGKKINITPEQLDIYVFSITVFVFYRCKILIPIGDSS